MKAVAIIESELACPKCSHIFCEYCGYEEILTMIDWVETFECCGCDEKTRLTVDPEALWAPIQSGSTGK